MSFGFSVGDFVAVIQLANKIRKDFVGAPGQFKAVSDELRTLSIVLQDGEIVSSESGLGDEQRTQIRDILDGCGNVLRDLEKVVNNYGELKSGTGSFGDRVKRVWKKLNWEPEDVRELRARVTSNIGLLNVFLARISSGVVFETKKAVDEINHRQAHQDRITILDWLTPTNYSSQQHDILNRRQPGTGQWFLDSPEYTTWMQLTGQTFFCPGIPGAGKTTLTSIVIDNITKRYQADSDVGIAYAYCDFRRQTDQTIGHFLATLLKQLAESQAILAPCVAELFNKHKTTSTKPTVDEILTTLRSVASTYKRVFVLIDALDECSNKDGCRTKLLSSLFSLQSSCKISLFATSRMIPEITSQFTKASSLEIRASGEDVKSYLNDRLSQLPAFVKNYPGLQKEIVTKIIGVIGGMFLLAKLHLDSLKGKRSPKALRNALERLASGSDAYDRAYSDTMERIECQSMDEEELAKQTLSWLTSAKRPLTTTELLHALAVEPYTTELDEENLSQIEDVVSVCAGLVTVDQDSDIIRLVHYTTQDFFDRTRSQWFPDAEFHIATTCMTYISFSVFDSGACLSVEDNLKRRQSQPLYSYAANNWAHHARVTPGTQRFRINNFLRNRGQIEAAIQALTNFEITRIEGSLQFANNTSKLHLAAYFGVQDVVRQLLEVEGPNPLDSHHRAPISMAAENGHENVVRLLLEKGARVDLEDRFGKTPLGLAGENGHCAIIQLLLDTSVTSQTESQNALISAVRNGHEAAVALLIERGVDFKSLMFKSLMDVYQRTPHLLTSGWVHSALFDLILDNYCRFPPYSDPGNHILEMAALNGHEGIVRLLLEKASMSELWDTEYSIDLAAAKGHISVVTLLQERRTGPDAVSWEQTPLHWAASRGYETLVGRLLEKGANVNLRDSNGRLPISIAAEKDDFGQVYLREKSGNRRMIVKLLLDKGVDFQSPDTLGRTPLGWASRNGHFGVVELLLSKHAAFTTEDKYGKTPLCLAVENGHEDIIKLILETLMTGQWTGVARRRLIWHRETHHESMARLYLQVPREKREVLASYAEEVWKDIEARHLLKSIGPEHVVSKHLKQKDSSGFNNTSKTI